MNQKQIGIIVIIIAILLGISIFTIKAKEDAMIDKIVKEKGSCFLEDGTCLHQDRNIGLYVFGWILSSVLIIFGIYLIIFYKTQRMPSEDSKEEKIRKIPLDEQEKNIINLLKKNDNSMYQSDLIKQTGLSKVKITRVLDKLESKKLIERKRRGMTNIVILRN